MSEQRDSTRTHADFDIRSPFHSYFRVTRDLLVAPEAFFRAVRGGSLLGPTLFIFITYSLVSVLTLLLVLPVLIYTILPAVRETPELGGANIPILALLAAAVFVITPLGGVLGTFLGALIWHPFVAISVGIGRGAGFRETYRIGAYQSLPYIAGNFIPFIGPILSIGAMAYVGVFGVKGAHGANTTRAIISVAVSLILIFLLFVAAIVIPIVLASRVSS